VTCGDRQCAAVGHDGQPSLRLLYLIFVQLCGWLVLPGRSSASDNAERFSSMCFNDPAGTGDKTVTHIKKILQDVADTLASTRGQRGSAEPGTTLQIASAGSLSQASNDFSLKNVLELTERIVAREVMTVDRPTQLESSSVRRPEALVATFYSLAQCVVTVRNSKRKGKPERFRKRGNRQ